MKKKNEPEKENDFEDAFIREIDEELKNEKLKKIWDRYGLFIILFVVVLISATVSMETFKAWNQKRNQEFSNAYAYALNLQNQGKYGEAMGILESIEKSKKGIYSDLAQIQIANVLIEQGKVEPAMAIWEKIIANKNFNQQMREVATIKLASYKLDFAPTEEVQKMLTPFVATNGAWTNIAKEMLAMLAIREGDNAQAKAYYQEISTAENTPEALRTRAQDMLNVLNDSESTKK